MERENNYIIRKFLNWSKTKKRKFYSQYSLRKRVFAGHFIRGSSKKLILTVLEGKVGRKRVRGKDQEKVSNRFQIVVTTIENRMGQF